MNPVFTRMPAESLCLREVLQVLINSLVLILHERSGPRSVSDFSVYLMDVRSSNRTLHLLFVSSLIYLLK